MKIPLAFLYNDLQTIRHYWRRAVERYDRDGSLGSMERYTREVGPGAAWRGAIADDTVSFKWWVAY